jgi:hypothetical protein
MANKIIAERELRQKRLKECFSCEYLKQPKNRCGKCGCFISAKVLFNSAKCPIKKW